MDGRRARAGPRLVVLGSLNVDLVLAGVPLPRPGETVSGGRFETHHGGKGGNAAVAAARALRGGPREGAVSFVGAVGADAHGRTALSALSDEGIDVRMVAVHPDVESGVALIVVAPDGENQIAVAPGANATLTPTEAEAAATALLGRGGVLLASLEVPHDAVEAAARAARRLGATFVHDPAPVVPATASLAGIADVITPNEAELDELGGLAELRAAHPGLCIAVTRGARGAYLAAPGASLHEPALAVRAVDATGAGDTFSGVLAAALLEQAPVAAAVHRANVAAGLSVRSAGAREGMPLRAAIDRAM